MITYGPSPVLAAIARLVTAKPRRVMAATVALLAVAVALGAPVTGKLTVDPDLDFIDPAAQSNVTGDELRRAIGRGLGQAFVVLVRNTRGGAQSPLAAEAAGG